MAIFSECILREIFTFSSIERVPEPSDTITDYAVAKRLSTYYRFD
jgi:hypothetical protein